MMARSKTQQALRAARQRHRRLDDLIDREQKRKPIDPYALQTLKKHRLAAKDQMLRLADAPTHENTT